MISDMLFFADVGVLKCDETRSAENTCYRSSNVLLSTTISEGRTS